MRPSLEQQTSFTSGKCSTTELYSAGYCSAFVEDLFIVVDSENEHFKFAQTDLVEFVLLICLQCYTNYMHNNYMIEIYQVTSPYHMTILVKL